MIFSILNLVIWIYFALIDKINNIVEHSFFKIKKKTHHTLVPYKFLIINLETLVSHESAL